MADPLVTIKTSEKKPNMGRTIMGFLQNRMLKRALGGTANLQSIDPWIHDHKWTKEKRKMKLNEYRLWYLAKGE